MKRVLVGMSGGLYSAVTAALLKNQGYEVLGIHLVFGDKRGEKSFDSRCCRDAVDIAQVRKLCDRQDILLHVEDVSAEFEDKVIDYSVHEYLQQRTPNPCLPCNTGLKFPHLLREAARLKCEYIATGHGIQIHYDQTTGVCKVHRAAENARDQSYFLYGLTQATLQKLLTPLGSLPESMVRKLADEFDFKAAPERIGRGEICFSGRPGYVAFIDDRTAPVLRPRGVVRTVDSQVAGEHFGLHRYTIGQKAELDVSMKDKAYSVVGFDPATQVLVIGPEENLMKRSVMLQQTSWLRPIDQLKGLNCLARVRPVDEPVACRVTHFENATVRVEFEVPQRALAPGQAVVFYQGTEVLGGGLIHDNHQGQPGLPNHQASGQNPGV